MYRRPAFWLAILILIAACFWSFYYSAKGGSPVLGAFLTMGLALLTAVGSDSIDALLMVNKALVLELSRCSFIDRRENAIFIGSYGTGKTHLAISLGICACNQGKKVRFYTVAGLINELLEAQSQLRLGKLESVLAKCDLIILDELGFVPFTKEGAEALFTFCSSRYEKGSMIITTNLDFARWKEIFGDDALTGALLDRLTHRCHILEMNGGSYRFKESLRRKKRDVN